MSLSAEIRAVLRKAPGPMLPSEVREALAGEYTATQVCGILNSMAKLGEAQRLDRDDGKQGYLLDPKYVAKRPVADDASTRTPKGQKKAKAVKPHIEKAPPQRAIARRTPRDPKAGTALTVNAGKFAGSVAAMLEGNSGAGVTVHIDRGSLRGLALAVMALHPGPMPDALKSTVLTAVEATL